MESFRKSYKSLRSNPRPFFSAFAGMSLTKKTEDIVSIAHVQNDKPTYM